MAALTAWIAAHLLEVLAAVAAIIVAARHKDEIKAKLGWGPKPDETMKADDVQFIDKIKTWLGGLDIIQDVKIVKGDFDAAKALFLNRALSHEVAKIVRTEDKEAAEKCYADAALLIAKADSAPTAAA